MTPEPEPPGDIRAQLAAVLDPAHPKLACYMVPDDARNFTMPQEGIRGVIVVRRDEGVLVTTDRVRAEMFRRAADDTTMAEILGYPEPKDLIVKCSPHPPGGYARAVQARDRDGHVVTEAYCSRIGLLPTCAELERHVPLGGELVIMLPTAAMARRVALRWIGF